MEELALKVEHVTKEYRLGTIGGGTLKGELQSKFAIMRGKEDPNSKIGSEFHGKNEKFIALDDVNFEIKKGEKIGIIGHNGAGKSTILKLICRVTAPTKGNIYINGRITSMLEVGTGFHGELTGRENIYLNGSILGMSKEEIDAKYDEIVEFSEIGKFIDTPVKRYSSGMTVKLGFSVASHLNSEIMIMDEVLAVGDMAFQKKCISQMRKAADVEGRTILYVSHNMTTIRSLCDRCIVFDHGKIIYSGDVEEAISIYMHENGDFQEKSSLDYSNIPRLDWLRNTKIRTEYAEYIGKTNNVFKENENIKLKLNWLNEKDVKNVSIRLEVLNKAREPIFTTVFYEVYSGKAGEHGEAKIEIDISNMISGRYTVNYVFFERNSIGQHVDIDCVHGLYFVVNKNETIKWNKKLWGYIKNEQSALLEIK